MWGGGLPGSTRGPSRPLGCCAASTTAGSSLLRRGFLRVMIGKQRSNEGVPDPALEFVHRIASRVHERFVGAGTGDDEHGVDGAVQRQPGPELFLVDAVEQTGHGAPP